MFNIFIQMVTIKQKECSSMGKVDSKYVVSYIIACLLKVMVWEVIIFILHPRRIQEIWGGKIIKRKIVVSVQGVKKTPILSLGVKGSFFLKSD